MLPFVAMIILFLLKRDVAKIMFLGVVAITMGPFRRVGVIHTYIFFRLRGKGAVAMITFYHIAECGCNNNYYLLRVAGSQAATRQKRSNMVPRELRPEHNKF